MTTAAPPAGKIADLAKVARTRGFQTWVAAAIEVIGLLPALYLSTTRGPGYESAPAICFAFIFGPASLLLVWTLLDREGQAGRQISMWFKMLEKSGRRAPLNPAVTRAVEDAVLGTSIGSLQEHAANLTARLSRFAPRSKSLAASALLFRFWYPILWTVVSGILVALFVAVILATPECAALGEPNAGAICH